MFTVGFNWFTLQTRTEKIFIPQKSQAVKDLKTAEKFFPVKIREAAVLVTPVVGSTVLTKECFKDLLAIHNAIVSTSGYSEVCFRLKSTRADPAYSKDCLMLSPMEIFHFNSSNFDNIIQNLNAVYKDTGYIMSNGRPCSYNFPRIFGHLQTNVRNIVSAEAVRMTFALKDKESDEILDWEEKFLIKMKGLKTTLSHVNLFYSAEKSIDDSVRESASGDVTLFSITITVMMTFTCAVLCKWKSPLSGHSLLSLAGLLAVAFGIASGFGFCMYIGIPFISITGVLPFLVIGIGIDDMFIIIDELDRQNPKASTISRLINTMTHVGSTITMTTVTDLVAFAVSTSSEVPAISIFCSYGALSLTFSYLYLITFFVVCIFFDDRRIRKRKLLCSKSSINRRAIKPLRQKLSCKVMKLWANFLMMPAMKVILFLLSILLLAGGIYGCIQVKEEFDPKMITKDGSYFQEYLKTVQEQFPSNSLEVSVVLEGDLDYSDPLIQTEISKLSGIAIANKYYSDHTISWINTFQSWASSSQNMTYDVHFVPALKRFLSIPEFALYKRDIIFNNETNTRIQASRILVYYKSHFDSIQQRDAMLTLREDLKTKSSLPAFPINRVFIFFEQYAITRMETIRNLIIASVAILIVTSPSLVNPRVIGLVFLSFIALVIELLGLMYIWNVTLNTVSMLILVMATGFSVDYSAHIAHAFVTSRSPTPEERVVDSLSTVGASVVMGGISTFLGVVVIAFASSEVFRIFFRTFFGIVVLGLLHGICFLPVLLSIFSRYHIPINHRQGNTIELSSSPTQSSANSVIVKNIFVKGVHDEMDIAEPSRYQERNNSKTDRVHYEREISEDRTKNEPKLCWGKSEMVKSKTEVMVYMNHRENETSQKNEINLKEGGPSSTDKLELVDVEEI